MSAPLRDRQHGMVPRDEPQERFPPDRLMMSLGPRSKTSILLRASGRRESVMVLPLCKIADFSLFYFPYTTVTYLFYPFSRAIKSIRCSAPFSEKSIFGICVWK